MCYQQRFGRPVYTSLLGVPPRLDSATFVKGPEICGAFAAESVQNGPFSGAAAENDVASAARNARAPGGPGASQTLCVSVFLKNEIHPGSASQKISKSYVGPKVHKWPLAQRRSTFSPPVVSTTLRIASAAKQIIFGPSCANQKLIRTLHKTVCFVQARAKIILRENKCAHFFKKIDCFNFNNFPMYLFG